jgi:hypothetical protein
MHPNANNRLSIGLPLVRKNFRVASSNPKEFAPASLVRISPAKLSAFEIRIVFASPLQKLPDFRNQIRGLLTFKGNNSTWSRQFLFMTLENSVLPFYGQKFYGWACERFGLCISRVVDSSNRNAGQ